MPYRHFVQTRLLNQTVKSGTKALLSHGVIINALDYRSLGLVRPSGAMNNERRKRLEQQIEMFGSGTPAGKSCFVFPV